MSVSNGIADNPGGVGGAAVAAVRHDGDRHGVQAPDGVHVVGRRAARECRWNFIVDVAYVGRRGLYLQRERNINQLRPGTIQANPGVNIAALRPYKGYGVIRLSENAGYSKYNSLQLSADRRYRNGFKFGAGLHARQVGGQRQRQAQRHVQHLRRLGYWGTSNFDRRHVLNFHYIYDLPFLQGAERRWCRASLGGWQISGSTFMRTGTPFWVTRTTTSPASATPSRSRGTRSAIRAANANRQFSACAARHDQNFWFNPAAFARPAAGTFGNAPRNSIYNPGQYQWDIALFKNVRIQGTRSFQLRARSSTS